MSDFGYGKTRLSDLQAQAKSIGHASQSLQYLVKRSRDYQPNLTDLRQPKYEVFGCEARVWVAAEWQQHQFKLQLDSESRVVRGLLAVLADALDRASAEQIAAFDLDAYLTALGLADYITVSRRHGLRAVVRTIQQLAAQRAD